MKAWQDHPRARLGMVCGLLGASAYFYATERSLEHFAWHLGYGAGAGMLLASAWSRVRRIRSPTLWPVASYLWMVIPDLLWLAKRIITGTPWPHQGWMDIFWFHVSLDRWALATPLVVPFYGASLAIYVAALMKARRVAPTWS